VVLSRKIIVSYEKVTHVPKLKCVRSTGMKLCVCSSSLQWLVNFTLQFFEIDPFCSLNNDNDNPIKSLLKGKGLLPPVGLAWLDS
jgi:phosphoserine phosphatase